MKSISNSFSETPHTKPGRWAIGLMIMFAVLFLINSFVLMPAPEPFIFPRTLRIIYGLTMSLCGVHSMFCIRGISVCCDLQKNAEIV
jgi:uncharacterized membrane protein YhdT